MYSFENLLTILRDPRRLRGVASHFGITLNQFYYRYLTNHSGMDVMSEDWDNLFLLDGCRYDLFEATNTLDGTLESRITPASDSSGFLHESFAGETWHDTVYVTANPHVFELPENTFHATVSLLDTGWDENLHTVRPDTVVNAIRDVHSEYPNKRLIAHFMQPHYPFIGEIGQQIAQGGIGRRDTEGGVIDSTNDSDVWVKLQYGLNDLSRADAWAAYRENLELVLAEIKELLSDMPGKTVLSADHGNLIGERISPIPCRGYGHPPHVYVDGLVLVPWLIIENGRKETTSEAPVRHDTLADDVVEDRLANLGYK